MAKTIDPKDINRETVYRLAREHVIINWALQKYGSPDSPEYDFEKALILMVMWLVETVLELQDLYEESLTTRPNTITVRLDQLSPDLKNLVLDKLTLPRLKDD